MDWPKRRTAPFFEGDIKLTSEETLASGLTRLLVGSCKINKTNIFSSTELTWI